MPAVKSTAIHHHFLGVKVVRFTKPVPVKRRETVDGLAFPGKRYIIGLERGGDRMRRRREKIKIGMVITAAALAMFMLAGCGGGAVGEGAGEPDSSAASSFQSVDFEVDEADSVESYSEDYPEGYEEFLRQERQNALEQDVLEQYNKYKSEEIEKAYEEYQREQSEQNGQGDGPFGW